MTQRLDLVVVDGGGTGTRLRAVGPDGIALAEARSGPSNLTYGAEAAWENVAAGLADLTQALGPAPDGPRLWCGLAGGRSPSRVATFRRAAGDHCRDIAVVTDGFAALIGAHGGGPGIVLAVGTGTAAYALGADGWLHRASAWGFAIGDEGSGAWIGRRAIQALARSCDGRATGGGPMLANLAGTVGGDYDAIQAWLLDASARTFAALAPMVVAADDAGDPLAAAILADGAAEISLAIAAVDRGGPIALLGGLADVYARRLDAPIRARLVPPRGTALDGLALMARRGWRAEAVPTTDAPG